MTAEQLGEWIDKLKVAFIGSVDDDGYPGTKAMLPPRRREGMSAFYFTTNTSSRRVAMYKQNDKACLYFYEKGRFKYQGVMLRGRMQVLEEAASKEMVWRDGDEMYYPAGVTDPDYCVLRFVVDTDKPARYYCNFAHEDVVLAE